MKVKCIGNSRAVFPREVLKYKFAYEEFYIVVDEEYVVYALTEMYGYIWYCLLDSEKGAYPMWYPSMLFKISDPRLSRYWICSIKENSDDKKVSFFSFPEWVNDDYFYSNLTDYDENEVKIFKKYKQLMNLEFPDRTILDKAEIADDKWLMCPFCIDAWENSDATNAMIKCPKCQRILHNPRYKDELPHF